MIHVAKNQRVVCGKRKLLATDSLVTAALASDCDECRVKLGVARVNDKTWDGKSIGVRSEPVFVAEPMNLDATKKRDQ